MQKNWLGTKQIGLIVYAFLQHLARNEYDDCTVQSIRGCYNFIEHLNQIHGAMTVIQIARNPLDSLDNCQLGAIQVLRNAISLEIGPPPTPS